MLQKPSKNKWLRITVFCLLILIASCSSLYAQPKSEAERLWELGDRAYKEKDAKRLYDMLLSEALKGIKENDRIIIIPDEILGLLPFEALVIKEGTGIKDSLYVADRYTNGK